MTSGNCLLQTCQRRIAWRLFSEKVLGSGFDLPIAPTLKGAPSKLRLGGGFRHGLHRRKTSEASPTLAFHCGSISSHHLSFTH